MAKTGPTAATKDGETGIVVLDTSALVSDPEVIYAYPDCEVVVPLTAIEELDGLKKRLDYTGKSAREAIRKLWSLIEGVDQGEISEPIRLSNGGTLRVEVNGHHNDLVLAHRLDIMAPDNRILNTALSLHLSSKRRVTLVSNDVSFRVKAAVVGIAAEELRAGAGAAQAATIGYYSVQVSSRVIDRLYAAKREERVATWADLGGRKDKVVPGVEAAKVNEYFDLSSPGGSQTAIVRVTDGGLRMVGFQRPYGLRGRNAEQHMAIDLLMDPNVPIVALAGHAGTGKTLLALATGLAQTVGEDFFFLGGCSDKFGNQKRAKPRPGSALYERMVIYRPLYSVGRQDVGFLPGDVDEKLGPWMEAVTDAMVALSSEDDEQPDGYRISYETAKEKLEGLKEAQRLSLDAITFLRGRSLQRHFLVVDEAQNFELNDLKTVLTRVGTGTKIVFVGDTTQIDNPYASAHTNALAYLSERFAGHPLFGHLVLQHGQRSEIADLAAERL
jgi:PhoH-like ATPase